MAEDTLSLKRKLESLFRERPKFHGREKAGTEHYPIGDDVLKWVFENLAPGSVTLETGCGYSTVVFSMISGHHTVISPFPQEHELIKKWCLSRGLPVEHIEFIASFSQEVIHTLGNRDEQDLDMVLVDGDHAFPAPFIDWYYTADRIIQGGYFLVDDTQLITGKILKDFLLAENQRWKCEIEMGKTTVFKKMVSSPAARGIPWIKQPYVNVNLDKEADKTKD